MDEDGVSVVIPAYNAADTLPRAIESVLNQTHENLELIIVDDASEDNTEEVVRKYQQKDSRLKYIKHEVNKERSAARNTGIKNAKMPYVAFLDSDDQWLPEKLEKQLSYLAKKGENWGGVYCNNKIIGANTIRTLSIPTKKNLPEEGGEILLKRALLQQMKRFGSSLLLKKDIVQNINGFNESLHIQEDYDLIIRFLKVSKLAYLDELLTIIYDAPSSSSENISKIKLDFLKRFENDVKYYENKGYPITIIQYLRISKYYYRIGDFHKATKFLLKAIINLNYRYLYNIDLVLFEMVSTLRNLLFCLKKSFSITH